MSQAIYTGPCKVYLGQNGISLQPDGANGAAKITLNEKTSDVATAMFGKIGETLDDQTIEIDTNPFANWGLLPTLFPGFLGVTTGSGPGFGAGALVIGTRPHGTVNIPCKVWTPDGRLYQVVRTAISGHPSMKLGNGQALFSGIKILGLGDPTLLPGSASFLLTANAITETGAVDPGYAFTLADYVAGRWTGAWGTLAGFGGDGGALMGAEDGFDLVPDIKYSPITDQKLTRHLKLDSAAFMIKGRLVGPMQSQIATAILAHSAGSRFGGGTNAASFVLTGPMGKTITLPQAEIKGAGFEFGGTKLGNGEIGFVSSMVFTGGVAQPLLVFSA